MYHSLAECETLSVLSLAPAAGTTSRGGILVPEESGLEHGPSGGRGQGEGHDFHGKPPEVCRFLGRRNGGGDPDR